MAGMNGSTSTTLRNFASMKREVFPQVRKALKRNGLIPPSNADLLRMAKAIMAGEDSTKAKTQGMRRGIAALHSIIDTESELKKLLAPAPKPEEKKPEPYKPAFTLEDQAGLRLYKARAITDLLSLYEKHSDEVVSETCEYATWALRDLIEDAQNYISAYESEKHHLPHPERVRDIVQHFNPEQFEDRSAKDEHERRIGEIHSVLSEIYPSRPYPEVRAIAEEFIKLHGGQRAS